MKSKASNLAEARTRKEVLEILIKERDTAVHDKIDALASLKAAERSLQATERALSLAASAGNAWEAQVRGYERESAGKTIWRGIKKALHSLVKLFRRK